LISWLSAARLPRLFGAAALAASLAGIGPARADLVAEQLTPHNMAALRQGGPDAIAGLGDWVIGNGTVCAAISDPEHESVLSARGGVLVDLGHCGRDDDQWGVLQPMLNLSRQNVLGVAEIRAEVVGREAFVITTGSNDGVAVETRFAVSLDQPSRLLITTRLERESKGESLFLFGEVSLHGHRQLTPFTLFSPSRQI
jgi:hypothetical protein